MKKLTLLIIVFMTSIFPSFADKAKETKETHPIFLEYKTKKSETIRHRAPERFSIEAFYEAASNSITIIYDGAAEGTATLSYEGTVIASQPEINTTFQLPYESGLYSVQVETANWTATGSLEL